jgi:hypothetical protein
MKPLRLSLPGHRKALPPRRCLGGWAIAPAGGCPAVARWISRPSRTPCARRGGGGGGGGGARAPGSRRLPELGRGASPLRAPRGRRRAGRGALPTRPPPSPSPARVHLTALPRAAGGVSSAPTAPLLAHARARLPGPSHGGRAARDLGSDAFSPRVIFDPPLLQPPSCLCAVPARAPGAPTQSTQRTRRGAQRRGAARAAADLDPTPCPLHANNPWTPLMPRQHVLRSLHAASL